MNRSPQECRAQYKNTRFRREAGVRGICIRCTQSLVHHAVAMQEVVSEDCRIKPTPTTPHPTLTANGSSMSYLRHAAHRLPAHPQVSASQSTAHTMYTRSIRLHFRALYLSVILEAFCIFSVSVSVHWTPQVQWEIIYVYLKSLDHDSNVTAITISFQDSISMALMWTVACHHGTA